MADSLPNRVRDFTGDPNSAEGRALADECLLACGWSKQHYDEPCDWVRPDGKLVDYDAAPNPLANVQHALDLLPEDWFLDDLSWHWGLLRFEAVLMPGQYPKLRIGEPEFVGTAHTMAAAITAAALWGRLREMEG